MNYTEIVEAIERYNSLSRDDILQEIKPIIKAYKTEYLAGCLGVSIGTLYSYTKANGNKITFESYIRLKALQR